MQATSEVKATRVEQATRIETAELVVEECPLTIMVNGHRSISLLCSPRDLEALVIGLLLAEGTIATYTDVASFHLDAETLIADVWLRDREVIPVQPGERSRASGCGLGAIYLDVINTCSPNQSSIHFTSEQVLALSQKFNKMSEIFLSTGGVHSAALCEARDILVFHEDIGRHNAVDKVVGSAAVQGLALADKLLLCSGRISSEMLVKAAKQSIPVVVSRSAPTRLAIDLASRLNITLVGFARGARMNIYTHAERITTSVSDR